MRCWNGPSPWPRRRRPGKPSSPAPPASSCRSPKSTAGRSPTARRAPSPKLCWPPTAHISPNNRIEGTSSSFFFVTRRLDRRVQSRLDSPIKSANDERGDYLDALLSLKIGPSRRLRQAEAVDQEDAQRHQH